MSRSVLMVAPTSAKDLELDALELLLDFQPSALSRAEPVDVERFFENRLPAIAGVDTDYRELPAGIFGKTDSLNNEVVISVDLISTQDIVKLRRGRATIVHESFHAIRHLPQVRRRNGILLSVNDAGHAKAQLFRQENVPAFRNAEWQAWRWGRAFIMPLIQLRKLVDDGATKQDIADVFNVNPKFVEVRLGDLEKLPSNFWARDI